MLGTAAPGAHAQAVAAPPSTGAAFATDAGGAWIDASPAAQGVRDLVTDSLARLSGQADPFPGAAVTASDGSTLTPASLGSALEGVSAPAGATAATDVAAEGVATGGVEAGTAAGLLPASLAALGPIALVGAAGATGYLIGTQIRRFVGLDAPAGDDPSAYSLSLQRAVPIRKGQSAPAVGLTYPSAADWTAPADGYVYGFAFAGNSAVRGDVETAGGSCGATWPTPPAGFAYTETATGTCGPYSGNPGGAYHIGVAFHVGSLPSTGVHAYDSAHDPQPITTLPPPAAPDPQTAQHKIGSVIEAPGHDALRQWYDAQLDPVHVQNPVSPTSTTGVTIPAPAPSETYQAYLARLQALGLVGQARVMTDATLDPNRAPGAVLGVQPAPGTRVAPGSTVVVRANPDTAPDPATDGVPGPIAPPTLPGIDLGPIRRAIPCRSFPWGVPCWVASALGAYVAAAHAPRFTVHWPLGIDGTVDLAPFDAYASMWRMVLLITTPIYLAWVFFSYAFGGGPGGGASGGEAE